MSQQTIGTNLRRAREGMPASLYQASRETKIRVDFLESMESDNFNFVSGGPYIKGMLRAYGRWLKLDEQQLTEEFSRAHEDLIETSITDIVREPARVPPRSRPHWMVWAGLASSILLVLSLVGVMNPTRDQAMPPETPKKAQPAKPSVTTQAPAVDAAGQPPAQAALGGVKLTLTVVGDKSWVEAYAEGDEAQNQPLFKGIVPGGDVKTFEAKDRLRTRIGNLGGVRITLNGRDLGVPGQAGQAGSFVFDPSTTSLTPAPAA